MREYLRPWKLFTLALGIGLLIAGSFYYRAPDWDNPDKHDHGDPCLHGGAVVIESILGASLAPDASCPIPYLVYG